MQLFGSVLLRVSQVPTLAHDLTRWAYLDSEFRTSRASAFAKQKEEGF
jgi:hypothetical protein